MLALAGCDSGGAPSDQPSVAAGRCPYTSATDAGDRKPGLPPGDPGVLPRSATIELSGGRVTFDFDPRTPCTDWSFAYLAGKRFFDDTPCPRVVDDAIFVLQCGDPTGTGAGGPGYTVPDENLAGTTYPAGAVAMANSGDPDTGGSQFFICYSDTDLPPTYTVFGHVRSGLGTIKAIAARGNDGSNPAGGGHPTVPVTIKTVRVS
jgi:peptidyl-prolyl cis-trans isomerase B (cyclophilin B)